MMALEFLYRWGLEIAGTLHFMKDRTPKAIVHWTEGEKWVEEIVGC